MNDSFKMFVIALVTAVATQLLLAPYILRLQGFVPGAATPTATAPAPAPTGPAPRNSVALTAPNLEGLSVDAARDRWRAKNITIIEDGTRADSGAKAGTILAQRPAPGEALESKEIRVTVAQAGEAAQVPDVIGQPLADARTALVDAGFEVPAPKQRKVTDAASAGKVVAMLPNAGAHTTKGATVTLTIAEVKSAPAPKVTGMYLSKAKKILSDAGLAVGTMRRVEHAELGSGYVLRQDPAEGDPIAAGGSIDLVVVAPN